MPARSPRGVARGRGGSLALILLVGWWGGTLVSEHREALAATRWSQAHELGRGALPAESWLPHPRALRRAAGVGPRRSVDLARYLWAEGPDADLEALAGIGPRTARAARQALAEAPTAPLGALGPPSAGSQTGTASGHQGGSPSMVVPGG